MSRTRRVGYLAVSMMLSTVVAACGSSSSGGTPAAGPNTVTIKGFAFNPSTLTVPVGTKVTFVMEDSGVQHNVTSTGSGATSFANSPNLSKGQSYSVTYTKAGTYTYKCSIHPSMLGKVIVQ